MLSFVFLDVLFSEKVASAVKENLKTMSVNPAHIKKQALSLLLDVGLERLASSIKKAREDPAFPLAPKHTKNTFLSASL